MTRPAGFRGLCILLNTLALLVPLSARGQTTGDGSAGPGVGEATSANECCLVLLLPVGARAVALGRTLTATATPDAAFANPAGLAGIDSDYFVIHHTAIAGEATAFSLLLTPDRVGTVGLSYQLLDFGQIETTDDRGQTVGSLSLRHHLLVASFATGIMGGLSAGLNYKLYQFRIGCTGMCDEQRVTATTHAIDAGLRYQPSILPSLQFGAAVSNIGFALQVVNVQQADPLPVRLRLGAAYEVLHRFVPDSTVALWLALDLEEQWREIGSPVASVGAELVAGDVAYLRAGYVPGDGVGTGASVGFGLRYTRFMVAVAKSFSPTLVEANAEPVQVSFGISF